MELRELLTHVSKHTLRDQAIPPLWPRDLLVQYFVEAEDQFARRTHCLTTEIRVTAVEDVNAYDLDPEVISILEIAHEDGAPIRDRSRRQMSCRTHVGRPTLYTCDAGTSRIKLHPTPDTTYPLTLYVAQLPTTKLSADSDVPTIPAEYHQDLCLWVAYRCLKNNDPEAAQMAANPEDFRRRWEIAVRDAKRAVIRFRSGPNPHARGNWTGKLR